MSNQLTAATAVNFAQLLQNFATVVRSKQKTLSEDALGELYFYANPEAFFGDFDVIVKNTYGVEAPCTDVIQVEWPELAGLLIAVEMRLARADGMANEEDLHADLSLIAKAVRSRQAAISTNTINELEDMGEEVEENEFFGCFDTTVRASHSEVVDEDASLAIAWPELAQCVQAIEAQLARPS